MCLGVPGKVLSIADDAQAIVSSANLNGRSLYWDTEAGLVLNPSTPLEQLDWVRDHLREQLKE